MWSPQQYRENGRQRGIDEELVERAATMIEAFIDKNPRLPPLLTLGHLAKRLGIQSRIVMALYPKGDQPYMFGLSQCSHPRIWTPHEERVFQEIGRRLADALTSLSIFRSLGKRRIHSATMSSVALSESVTRARSAGRISWPSTATAKPPTQTNGTAFPWLSVPHAGGQT